MKIGMEYFLTFARMLCHADRSTFRIAVAKVYGEHLELACKKVAEEGYCFKKGKSRSKLYGRNEADVSEPK